MKKLLKGAMLIAAISIVINITIFVVQSCQQDESITNVQSEKSRELLRTLTNHASTLMSTQLLCNSEEPMRFSRTGDSPDSIQQTFNDGNTTIYIHPGEGLRDDWKKRQEEKNRKIETLEDLVRLHHETACEFSYIRGKNPIDSFEVSDPVIKHALSPLLSESKQFLYDKGFTEAEIQTMITDAGGTEDDLILLTLMISSDEANQQTLAKACHTFNPFATSAYASNIDTEKVLSCAIATIGWDFRQAAKGLKPTPWTKALIKKAFRKIAVRLLGPIGVMVAVAEFSTCVAGIDLFS